MISPLSKSKAILFALSLGPHLSCQPAPKGVPARAFTDEALQAEYQYAADKAKLDDIRAFYYNVFGRDQYTTQWSELDNFRSGSGIPERKPYLDSWYPNTEGGTNVGGALSRYDQAFYNGQSRAASWEVNEHGAINALPWFGHCDGTSAASIRYINPQRSVARPSGCNPGSSGCTVFSPNDIRALLSEISMRAKAKFIAGDRCRLTSEQLSQRPNPRSNLKQMDSCDDVNPASFHVGLVNFLGRMKQPLVFDESHDEEVWNYPIYNYSYTATQLSSASAALDAAGYRGNEWVFNPDVVRWYYVTMTIGFRTSRRDLVGAGTVPASLSEKTYSYVLEVNKQGQIVGGEWSAASRLDHPDFLWMPFEPSTTSNEANPHINIDEVTKMWAESVGLDPSSPFRDKPDNPYDVRFFPTSDDVRSWGFAPGYYQLVLDGRRTGATFLGKKTYLRVEVDTPLKAQAQVEVLVNGSSVGKSFVSNSSVDVQFDSKPGINIIGLRWTSQTVPNAEINKDFRYYAM